MPRSLAGLFVLVALASCAGEPPASVDLVAVPTQTPGPILDIGPLACPAALGEGTLVRDDEFGLAVQGDPLFPPFVVVWPNGWVARDVDGVRQLLDDQGRVMASEGDHFMAGGGYHPPNDWFHPCGEMTFTAG